MKNILNWIKQLYFSVTGLLLEGFRKHAETAVLIVENLKMVLDSPIPDIITLIVPGSNDDKLVATLRVIVPLVLEKTAIAVNIVKAGGNRSKIIEKALAHLKMATKEQKTLFYVTFAAELNIALADGEISFGEAIILSQLVYKEMKK